MVGRRWPAIRHAGGSDRPPAGRRGDRRRGPRGGSVARAALILAALALGGGPLAGLSQPVRAATPAAHPPSNPDCLNASDPLVRAAELMADRYRLGEPLSVLGSHPIVTLGPNLTWTEDPFHDSNWQFQLHAMRYVLDLFSATRLTGDTAYQLRGMALLQDWTLDNPRSGAPSVWAWNDHSTALRAVVLACAADLGPMPGWLRAALDLHGRTLANPAFYVGDGNHALNQSIGLLEIGRVLDRADWRALAGARINALIGRSIDAEGVTNEQAVAYQGYNLERYTLARARLELAGLVPGAAFARLALMPELLAHATLPDGTYEMIGDTGGQGAIPVPGTVAEFAATGGATGPKPTRTVARFHAGYLFARTGWGEHRAFADETALSVRWGAAPFIHGHADGLAITLAAWGSRLLVDPGRYSYTPGPYRTFFKGRTAHNVVTVDGAAWSRSAATRLIGYQATARVVDLRLQAAGYGGVSQTRRITWSRGLDYLLVEDRLASASIRTYRQLWHLPADARPEIGVSSVWTRRPKGNVLIRQLAGAPSLRIVTGRTAPVQGWISYAFNRRVAAPVVEAVRRGTTIRYLTLIVPAAGRPQAVVSGLVLTSSGYSVTIAIGAKSERLTVSGGSVWIHALD